MHKEDKDEDGDGGGGLIFSSAIQSKGPHSFYIITSFRLKKKKKNLISHNIKIVKNKILTRILIWVRINYP